MYGPAPLRHGPFRADDQDLRLGHVSQRQPGRQCLAQSCHVAEQKPGPPCFTSCQDSLACLDLMRSWNEDVRTGPAGEFRPVRGWHSWIRCNSHDHPYLEQWSRNGFFVLLCAQLLEEGEGRIFSYAAASTLWRRRSNPARPYMDRLMTFNRLICPSTGPVLQGSVKAACTASRS